ncbi:MAG: endonuclease MutS2 [Bacilli bacterium]|nr:endonuclease MutS2 [Bacilli bacterium]
MEKNRLYQKLEFNIILQQIMAYAHNDSSKSVIASTTHQTTYDQVNNLLKETDELMRLTTNYQKISLNNFYDVKAIINNIDHKRTLDGLSIIRIIKQQESISFLKELSKQIKEHDRFPILLSWLNNLNDITLLANKVYKMIDDSGLVYEDASANLLRISKEIKILNDDINNYLRSFVQKNSDHLMDNIITTRNNRYVVMVKLSSKNIIKGIIHDESSSKQTIFIEPSHIVNLNNKIQSLEFEKLEEMSIILQELSQDLYNNINIIIDNYNILEYIDVVNAKALYSLATNSIIPQLNEDSAKLEIFNGKHPLIADDKVVANDFYICNDESKYRIVLISGSNTGGKSVTLKMVGLFSLMVQSGIGIQASSNSNFPIYSKIFVDIGDEQSIITSLSTFSAHLSNVINITKEVSEYSLVLLDELGSGTDPREGENLALAIIEYLYAQDASLIVTTHYSKLKNYAITKPYVRSASVAFDEKTKLPMFKLNFDTFASSNAFIIAQGLGLSSSIVKQALTYYHEDLATSEELLLQLQTMQQEYTQKENILEQQQALLEKERISLVHQKEQIEISKDKIIKKALDDANDIVATQKEQANQIISKLKKEDKFINHKINEYQSELNKLHFDNEIKVNNDKQTFILGDIVKVLRINSNGSIKEILANKQYNVLVGNMSIKVKHDEIAFIQHQTKENKTKVRTSKLAKKSARSEINLIGLRVEEAQRTLNKFLDDAIIAKLNKVRIIHGFGTGALRIMVQSTLKNNKNIKSFAFASYQEGGQGATVAELN